MGRQASLARAMEGLLVAPSTATPIRTMAGTRARTHKGVADRGGGSTLARLRWCGRCRSGMHHPGLALAVYQSCAMRTDKMLRCCGAGVELN